MCGGKSTTTQQTTIPEEVMARYNAVNARAENVAQQPFQRYAGEFVAPLTATQQAGIGNINQSAGLAQGAFNQAQGVQQNAYSQAMPYLQQATQAANTGYGQAANQFGQAQGYLTNAANQGQIYGGQAYQPISTALSSAQPYMQQATALTSGGLGAASPMMGAAEGYLGGGTQAVNAQEFGQAQINKYMSPYMKNVVEAQQALQQQEAAAQRSALNSQAIGAGAFGGDRAGITQANLARQQSLANQATLGNLLQQGYGQAANMFQQQQGVNLAAAQANRAAQQFGSQQAANLAQQRYAQQMGVGQQMAALGQQQFGQNIGAGQALAGLGQQMYQQGMGASQASQGLGQAQYGMGAQQAGLLQGLGSSMFGMGTQQAGSLANLGAQQQAAALQGAQAQIGAGTLEQQTRQAENTARYNEFLQERGYPFQVAQFLANIAMGTGALSGSTTTTTQPNSFFSDRRLKKDIKEIGETHDGLPIYSFKYKEGDDQPRIGVMADEAREKHPDAVHRVGGIDAVDYEKIANRASEGGGVMPHRAGEGFADGGHVSPEDLAAILAMQKQFLGPHGQGGLYGQSAQNLPGGKGIVPQASLPVGRLPRHSPPQQQQQTGMQQAMSQLRQAEGLGESLLGEKGIFTKGGLPAKIAQKAGVMPTEQADKSAPKTPSAQQQGVGAAKSGNTAKDRGIVQDFSQTKTSEAAPSVGGVMPETKMASADMDAITPRDEDIFEPSAFAARGGVIPHKAAGGHLQEKVLPYQSTDPYGVEAVNEAESGDKYELMKPDAPPPKSKSGFENVLDAAKLATKVVGMFMLKDGGVVPRMPFEEGGEAKKDRLREYYDYMVSKGEPSHVAAGIVGNIAKESNGNPTIWGDNDNSFGLFQKNVRGELPAYQAWARENKRDMNDPYAQIDHVLGQMRGVHSKTYQQMLESNDPAKAAYQFAVGYERPVPATANYEGRMEVARKYAGGVNPEGGVEGYIQANLPKDDGKRRSAAPAQYEGGVETVDGQETSSGLMPTNFRTGKPFKSAGDFLTDRQFIVPLLTGVGAMASSPSRYFGGALLQGIGAAAQSYGGQEKTQQEIAESQARTFETTQRAANLSMFTDPKTGYTMVRLANGQTKPLYEWIDSQEELLGGPMAAEAARQQHSRQSGSQGPSAGGAAAGQPQAGASPEGKPQAKTYPVPQGVVYDNDSQQRALMDRKQAFVPGGDEVRAQSLKYANGVNTAANSAQQTRNLVNEMAMNVANVVAGKGLEAPGFAFPARAQAFEVMNFIQKQYDPKAQPFSDADTKQQLADKYNALIATATTAGANQDTLGALQTVYRAMPQTNMSPDAQAQLAAELLVYNRRERDRQAHLQRWNQASMNNPYSAGADFDEKNSKQYLQAIDLIKDVIRRDNKTFAALVKGNVSPEQVEAGFKEAAKRLGKPYVPGMSRFFAGG